MPAGLLGAAAVAGAANTLWQYNRENYMFDVPLRQSRDFQKQNVNLARYALFREDIRDIASLTTDKVSNLLVTNTLKVGFVVTVYFNFDRTDDGFARNTWHDQVLCVVLCMTLMTSFFFLMTSIWFAMHALQLAQAITTKLLVQVVRIPMPTELDIAKAASEGKEFEMNFREALRVPFIRDDPNSKNGQTAARTSTANLEHQLPSDDISMSDISGLQRLPHRMKTMVKEGMENTPQPKGGATVTTLNELIYGYDLMEKTFSQMEAHLKLLNLVASSWQPFDLYSKVTTVLGSSCLFSGLAYYAIYYMKPHNSGEVTPEAWFCFLFMSTLAWWNMTIEIAGSKVDLAITALFICVGPGWWLLTDRPSLTLNLMQKFGCPFLIFTQAVWISYLGIKACTFGGVWPHFFTSTRFLNVMHKQRGPIEIPRDIARKAKEEDQWAWDDTSSCDSASGLEDVNRAMAIAQPLVDALSCIALQPQSLSSRYQVVEARDTLREAARAAGVSRSTVLIKGFFISLEMTGDQEREMQWVDPCGLSDEPDYATAPETVSLAEVVEMAHQVADILYTHAVKWTVDDMVNLASYGGEPVAGVHSFLFQFETTYEKSAHFRPSADYLFKVAMALVTLFWILALLWAFWFSINVFNKITLTGEQLDWQLPQPWRMVKSFGCELHGTHFTVTDGYTVQVLNSDGSLFLHFEACGDGPVLAVDFGQGGEVIACCEKGTQSTWIENGKVVRQQWVSNFTMLTDIAVDRTPLETDDHIDALAIRNNQLLGIVFEPTGWRIFGALTLPQNKDRTEEITALAIRLGRALILTNSDEVFEMDVPSGMWAGPMLLPTLGSKVAYDWISVCRLSGARWRFVGQPSASPIQLWAFTRPPVNDLPPRKDEDDHQLSLAA